MRALFMLGIALAANPPAADFDKDGVADIEDDCPTDPGDAAGRGCPAKAAPPPPPPVEPPPADPPLVVEVQDDHLDLKEPVFFDTGSARIQPRSFALLELVAEAIRGLGVDRVISVEGHTDDRGARRLNLRLSKQRAQAVVDRLILYGVPKTQLRATGHGPDDPIAPNDGPEGRALNRRVEFLIQP